VYNNGGQLTSATNPENGTVTYSYIGARLDYKRDAKSQKTQYRYDSGGRVTAVEWWSPTNTLVGTRTFEYDSSFFGQAVQGRLARVSWGGMSYSYSYHPAGAVMAKRLTIGGRNLDAVYEYDNEGRMAAVTAPLGKRYWYTYNERGLPATMSFYDAIEQRNEDVVKNVSYNAAGQMTGMQNGTYLETRGYNVLNQLTSLTSTQGVNLEYRYSSSQNDGRITQQKDWVSGEEVTYTYDSLKRLAGAVTTGPEWGLSFSYDGFGNRTGQTVTKGTGPSFSAVYQAGTNWMVGRSYDANGNELVSTYWTYNHENRVVATGNETYEYDAEGKRILRNWLEGEAQEEKSELTFWGIDGRRMGTYRYVADIQQWQMVGENLYFAGKLVRANGAAVVVDRLGSVVSGGRRYLPYGEERVATANGQDKFATYYRDVNGLDYADQRYYSSQMGRFLTPDPVEPYDLDSPGSFNLYAYTENDPINYFDPDGLAKCRTLEERYSQTFISLGDLADQGTVFGRYAGVVWKEASNLIPDQTAVAYSLVFRSMVVEGRIWIARPNANAIDGVEWASVATLGWGKPGSMDNIIGAEGQFDTVEVVNGVPKLKDEAGLNAALDSDESSAACLRLRTAVSAAINAWIGAYRLEQIPFMAQGLVTSFNTSPIQSRPWEARLGSVGSANVFYGVPHGRWFVPNTPGPAPLTQWRPEQPITRDGRGGRRGGRVPADRRM
jgi:RHS repeat-associated protein